MTQAAITAEIIRLADEGHGDDAIARKLGITRHAVRKVLAERFAARLGGSEVRDIGIDQILVLEGRRAVAGDKVQVLAEAIETLGLSTPITVRENPSGVGLILVAGRHRIEAFRSLGRTSIPAFVRPASTTEAEARMLEISENLHRAELTALEKSQQIAEWRVLAKVRKTSAPANVQPTESGNREAARELGIDEKAVRDAVKIAEKITPEAAEAAREAGIDDNQSKLLKVAAAAPERQVETVHKLAGARAIMASRVEPDDSLDFFATPPWATRALMECVLPHLGIDPRVGRDVLGRVWEPACGEGHMSEVLAEYADNVFASDIFGYRDGQVVRDFLDAAGVPPVTDWIITNPPFGNQTIPFVLRALETAKIGVAMFVRLQWLEGIERWETIFRDRPPTFVCPFVERVNLCKGKWDPDGTTATAYSWLVWAKVRAPAPAQMFWVPPGCREALTKPDDRARFAAWSLSAPGTAPPPSESGGEEIVNATPGRFVQKVFGASSAATVMDNYIRFVVRPKLPDADNIESLLTEFIVPLLGAKKMKQVTREWGRKAAFTKANGGKFKHTSGAGWERRQEAHLAWINFLTWADNFGYHRSGVVHNGDIDHDIAVGSAAAPSPEIDPLDLPDTLRVGHPQCWRGQGEPKSGAAR
jgi:ParB/RepB/Spo0J family partition protein